MPDISVTDLQAATAALNAAAAQLRGDHKAMSDWSTTQADTVTVKDEAGQEVLVPSLHYLLTQFSILETDVRALLGTARASQLSDYYRERDLMLAQVAASGALVREVNRDWGTGTTANLVTMPDSPDFVVAGHRLAIRNEFRFPPAPDGRDTFNRASGERLRHSSADAAFDAEAVGGGNVEVVIRRKDVWATEVWLEAITPEHPHIFPGGDVHSTEATMDGFATEDSTRPDSYHAMYKGEALATQPKGINLYAIPAAQLVVHLQNPANGLYQLPGGGYAQRRKRNHTFAGAGNGDWQYIDPASKTGLAFNGYPLITAPAQGAADSLPADTSTDNYFVSRGHSYAPSTLGKGVYQASNAGSVFPNAVNGECYLVVHGEWARLNSGHHHPSHNDWGTAIPHINNDPAQGGVLWHDYRANHLNSVRACFTALKRYDGSQGGGTGHPSGRFNDIAYPGGQGGIIDRRLSAYRTSQADHDREDAKVKAGTYRGLETVKRTYVSSHDATAAAPSGPVPGHNYVLLAAGVRTGAAVGRPYYVVNGDTNEVAQVTAASALDGPRHPNLYFPSAWGAPSVVYSIQAADTGLSVSGAFTHLTVIGNPANIAQCAALAGGWLGDWCPVIPDATTKVYPFGRKLISTGSLTYTSDNGASWNSITGHGVGWNESTNSKTVASGPNDVGIHTYTAWANMTEPCANALLRDGEAGISGTVFQQMRSAPTAGALLTASLIGKVPTDNGSGYTYGNLSYLGGSVFLGKLYPSRMPHRHEPVSLRKPLNSSPASKSLRYSHVDAGLVTNCYAYAELRFDPDYDSANDFGSLIQPDHSQAWNAGQKYRIQTDDGVICVVCVNSHNGAQFQNFTQLPTGEWSISTGVVYFRPWYGPAAGWGDSGEMPIVDNNGTWLDDNGHTLRAGTHKLALPFGWA